jgi:acyl-CoA reductase-like NAD-dependent aldehyde dehydrogenase
VTGEKLWDVPIATQQDVDDAVVSAQKAFEKFRYTEMSERKKLLQKIKDQYMSHVDEIAELLIKETGKPVGIFLARKVG